MIHVRGTIAHVAGECPYANNTTEVLGKRVKLFLWEIGGKAVDINVRDARLVRLCFSYSGYTRRFRINLNAGNRMR
jgi:hypothetical protein